MRVQPPHPSSLNPLEFPWIQQFELFMKTHLFPWFWRPCLSIVDTILEQFPRICRTTNFPWRNKHIPSLVVNQRKLKQLEIFLTSNTVDMAMFSLSFLVLLALRRMRLQMQSPKILNPISTDITMGADFFLLVPWWHCLWTWKRVFLPCFITTFMQLFPLLTLLTKSEWNPIP